MTKKVSFKVKYPENLLNFLNKFSSISQSILISLSKNGELSVSANTADKTTVKHSKISFENVFSEIEGELNELKFGIFSINKLKKSIPLFKEDFLFNIYYEKIDNEYVGTEIELEQKDLKINFSCASLKIFNIITNEQFSKICSLENQNYLDIDLTQEKIKKIIQLFSIDSEDKFLFFEVSKDKSVYSLGKTFKIVIDELEEYKNFRVGIFKTQFEQLDNEDYKLTLLEDRLIFTSKNSETIIILGAIYEE